MIKSDRRCRWITGPGQTRHSAKCCWSGSRRARSTTWCWSPPCKGFSRARYSNVFGPPPLRSSDYPWGFPWLEGARLASAERENGPLRISLRFLSAVADLRDRQRAGSVAPLCQCWFEFPEDLGTHRRGDPASPWQIGEFKAYGSRGFRTGVAFSCVLANAQHAKPCRALHTLDGADSLLYEGWPGFKAHATSAMSAARHYAGPLPTKCPHEHHPVSYRRSRSDRSAQRRALRRR